LNDHWALEYEAGVIQASLEKSPADSSGMPDKVEESGLSDVEGQIHYRWFKEKKVRPELFNYFECAMPTQEKGSLIGTTDWEFKLGMGLVKGFRWGTMTLRGAFEYYMEEEQTELGETAVEYLKRLGPQWRIFFSRRGGGRRMGMYPRNSMPFSAQHVSQTEQRLCPDIQGRGLGS
jgi:hypothetical protein